MRAELRLLNGLKFDSVSPSESTETKGCIVKAQVHVHVHTCCAASSSRSLTQVFQYHAPAPDQEPLLELAKCWDAQPAFMVSWLTRPWLVEPTHAAMICQEGRSRPSAVCSSMAHSLTAGTPREEVSCCR